MVFYRTLFGTLFVAALALATRQHQVWRRPPIAVYGLGILLAVHWTLYFFAIKNTSTASAVLLTYMAPVFMAAISPFMLKERIRLSTVAALLLSIAGTVVITLSNADGPEDVRLPGVLFALAGGLAMALLITATKRYAQDTPPLQFILHQSFAAGVLYLPFLFFFDYSLTSVELIKVSLLGVVFTGLSGVIFIWALHRIPATNAGILSYLEPVSTAVLAAILLGEALTPEVIFGCVAIVLAGTIVVVAPPGQKRTPKVITEELPGVAEIVVNAEDEEQSELTQALSRA